MRKTIIHDAKEQWFKSFDRVEDFGIFQVRLRPIRLRECLSDLFGADVTLHHPFSRVLRDCEIPLFRHSRLKRLADGGNHTMAISAYIAKLREKVGNELLLLPAVTAVILDERNRALLHRSSDDGKWYTIGGAIDPGEEPAPACAREVLEETGLVAVPSRIVAVGSSPVITYPNGHRCQYISTAFLCEVVGGKLQVSEESRELRYFEGGELEALGLLPYQLKRLRHVLQGNREPLFEPAR